MAGVVRTRYAKSGDFDIAYQIIGDGPIDLLMFTGPSIPLDCIDTEPSMARFQRRLASFARVIRFDLRGIGLSSHMPVTGALGPEYWADDALAVMNAAGAERAVVFAPAFAAMTAMVLAARHPDRVASLIIVNGAARVLAAPDYPAGVTITTAEPFLGVAIEPDAVEQGFDVLAILAPSVARDDTFRAWWDMSGNRAATPSMARAVTNVLVEADVRDAMREVSAPTLILHRSSSPFVPIEHGRYLADNMQSATFVELPGDDALFWVGDTSRMLDEIEQFVTGTLAGGGGERVLTTILFTDIVQSTELAARLGDHQWHDLLDRHDLLVRQALGRFGGREVNTAGDGFVAAFASPSRAIECAQSITRVVRALGIDVRCGVHAGEVEMRGQDLAGMAVHIAARVAALAHGGEVWVSSTVRDVVTGSGRQFSDRGEHVLKGVPGSWPLFAADDPETAG